MHKSARVHDGEAYHHAICEYFPKHAERAARVAGAVDSRAQARS